MNIYQDELLEVSIPETPGAKGHVKISLKKSFSELSEEDFAHAMSASSFLSNMLFEQGGAQGTNILFFDKDDEFNILTRNEGDGLSFQWSPQSMSQDELGSLADKIKDKCDYIGVEQAPTPVKQEERVVESETVIINKPEETHKKTVNYLLKKLDKLP